MVKSRFTATDVRAMVRDLRSKVLGMRIVNIYDVNAKTYLFKLAASGQEKIILILESGIRFHTTKYSRDKPDMPSQFSMKLRKHIKTKRLEDVRQIGFDRVVDFKFGSGDTCNHVILELYASGNIILTDSKYEILNVLRTYVYEENVSTAVKQIYPAAHATNLETSGPQQSSSGKSPATDKLQINSLTPEDLVIWIKAKAIIEKPDTPQPETGKKKKKQKQKLNLKSILQKRGSGVDGFGPSVIEHLILQAGLDPNAALQEGHELEIGSATELVTAMQAAAQLVAELDRPGQPGFISVTEKAGGPAYEDFLPHKLHQHDACEMMELPSFDEAVDEFFYKIEEQKMKQEEYASKQAGELKLEKIRKDQESRRQELNKKQELVQHQASLIEQFADKVDAAITVIRSALDNNIDWQNLEELVKTEQRNGNPVASLICGLKLQQKTISLSLGYDESDKAEVDVSVELSAHANARALYESAKAAKLKMGRTLEAMENALVQAEKQVATHQRKQQVKRNLQVARKTYWFEKFHWFITAENYLVLSGRDAQQNELLVKRYLRPCDIYVHADLHGASSCVVRNKDARGEKKISPLALQEAGSMTVCRSSAWKIKMVTSAWWVFAHQVSKTAPTGEYLTTGSFMIRGKKNFLPPNSLEMGFAILFKVDPSCAAAHAHERRERVLGGDDDDQEHAISTEARSKTRKGKLSVKSIGRECTQHLIEQSQAGSSIADGLINSTRQALQSQQEDRFKESDAIDKGVEKVLVEDERCNEGPQVPQTQSVNQDQQQPDSEDKEIPPEILANGMETTNEPENEDQGHEDVSQKELKAGGKKRISAKQRKEMKKLQKQKKAGQPIVDMEALSPQKSQKQQKNEIKKTTPPPRGKKGKIKKAQRRYRDQDEEDKMLAMEALGLLKLSKCTNQEEDEDKEKQKSNTLELLQEDSKKILDGLPESIREKINSLEKEGLIRSGELDVFELRTLSQFGGEAASEILDLFAQSDLTKIANKSGFLAGIMRRYYSSNNQEDRGIKQDQDPTSENIENDQLAASKATDDEPIKDTEPISRRHQKRREEEEIQKLLEEEGETPLISDAQGEEVDCLIGRPLDGEILLNAIPVCAPYSSLQGYKYKVKLTPGQQKKGKAAKQAIEIFTRSKACPNRERELMVMLTDINLVDVMIGDVKVNTPGLHAMANTKRKSKKSKKKNR